MAEELEIFGNPTDAELDARDDFNKGIGISQSGHGDAKREDTYVYTASWIRFFNRFLKNPLWPASVVEVYHIHIHTDDSTGLNTITLYCSTLYKQLEYENVTQRMIELTEALVFSRPRISTDTRDACKQEIHNFTLTLFVKAKRKVEPKTS